MKLAISSLKLTLETLSWNLPFHVVEGDNEQAMLSAQKIIEINKAIKILENPESTELNS